MKIDVFKSQMLKNKLDSLIQKSSFKKFMDQEIKMSDRNKDELSIQLMDLLTPNFEIRCKDMSQNSFVKKHV